MSNINTFIESFINKEVNLDKFKHQVAENGYHLELQTGDETHGTYILSTNKKVYGFAITYCKCGHLKYLEDSCPNCYPMTNPMAPHHTDDGLTF